MSVDQSGGTRTAKFLTEIIRRYDKHAVLGDKKAAEVEREGVLRYFLKLRNEFSKNGMRNIVHKLRKLGYHGIF